MKIKSKFAIYNIIMADNTYPSDRCYFRMFCADIYIKISCRRIKYIKGIND